MAFSIMTEKITRKFLDELIEKVSILDFMEKEYDSDFRTSSNNWLNTNCPFPSHEDNSPSFGVNAESNKFHCFGCGETGDIIKLVQNVEGLNFIEAIQRLSLFYGVEIETSQLDLKYLLNDLNNSIKQYLENDHGTNFPGGLSETEFLITFSLRTRKAEKQTSYNDKFILWIDQMYKQLEKMIDDKNFKQINLLWKNFGKESKSKILEIGIE